MSAAPRVAIVGGGVIGLAIAFRLVRRGADVVVLERDRVGDGATAAAGGMLAPVSEADTEPDDLVAFGRESLDRYPAFVGEVEAVSGVDCGYRASGTLWVALHADHRDELDHVARGLERRGLSPVALSRRELSAREPRLSPRVVGGFDVPEERRVDPPRLARALRVAIERSGGSIVERCAVLGWETRGGDVTGVRAAPSGAGPHGETVACDRAVLAAGAESAAVGDTGRPDPRLRPVKGHTVRVRGAKLLDAIVRTPDVYAVPQPGGALVLGATSEELGFDRRPSAGAAFDLLRRGIETVPEVRDLELEGVRVGLRPATEDGRPRLGPCGPAGAYVAVGHYRGGILMAARTADAIADAVLDDRLDTIPATFLADAARVEARS